MASSQKLLPLHLPPPPPPSPIFDYLRDLNRRLTSEVFFPVLEDDTDLLLTGQGELGPSLPGWIQPV